MDFIFEFSSRLVPFYYEFLKCTNIFGSKCVCTLKVALVVLLQIQAFFTFRRFTTQNIFLNSILKLLFILISLNEICEILSISKKEEVSLIKYLELTWEIQI